MDERSHTTFKKLPDGSCIVVIDEYHADAFLKASAGIQRLNQDEHISVFHIDVSQASPVNFEQLGKIFLTDILVFLRRGALSANTKICIIMPTCPQRVSLENSTASHFVYGIFDSIEAAQEAIAES